MGLMMRFPTRRLGLPRLYRRDSYISAIYMYFAYADVNTTYLSYHDYTPRVNAVGVAIAILMAVRRHGDGVKRAGRIAAADHQAISPPSRSRCRHAAARFYFYICVSSPPCARVALICRYLCHCKLFDDDIFDAFHHQ